MIAAPVIAGPGFDGSTFQMPAHAIETSECASWSRRSRCSGSPGMH